MNALPKTDLGTGGYQASDSDIICPILFFVHGFWYFLVKPDGEECKKVEEVRLWGRPRAPLRMSSFLKRIQLFIIQQNIYCTLQAAQDAEYLILISPRIKYKL